jgi:hypothetical protein
MSDELPPPPEPIEPPPPPPAQQAQVRSNDRLVLATGFFPTGSPDPATVEIMDLDEDAWAEFQAAPPGEKHLAEDGTLTVVPPDPLPLRYLSSIPIEGTVHTTNDTPTPIITFTPEANRLYRAAISFMATNPTVAGTLFRDEIWAWKKVGTANPVITGTAQIFNVDESQSADWNTEVVVSGANVVVRVIGERTGPVDWLVSGTLSVYVPAGYQV